MSRGRRQMIQLDEATARGLYSNEPTYNPDAEQDDEDDDDMGDMPTPERLVTDDMLPDHYRPPPQPGGEMDSKVANFLAEIDALDEGSPDQPPQSISPAPPLSQLTTVRNDLSPARDTRSPVRTTSKHNAYSSMFVKGTPEFTKPKREEKSNPETQVQSEPWPEEPVSEWQQLTDETTNYPYYWNTQTNAVVWDMPPEFSQYLILQKEYEERVERGLREGKLDPKKRPGAVNDEKESITKEEDEKPEKDVDNTEGQRSRSYTNGRRQSRSSSEDSSSDSSDSDRSLPRDTKERSPDGKGHSSKSKEIEKGNQEVSSSTANVDRPSMSKSTVSPDTTRPDDRGSSKPVSKPEPDDADDSLDFDLDDIDKQLEMALEKKRQELLKSTEPKEKDKDKSGDRAGRSDSREDEDRHRSRHSRHHRDRRDRDGDREERKPKLTLKERLRIEMELKQEKERRKKKALIEEMMAKELDKTVGAASSSGRSHKRHYDDMGSSHGYKRYRYDDNLPPPPLHPPRSRGYDDYRDEYDRWERRAPYPYDRFGPDPLLKPPPPTAEMLAYEEERRSQVVDYAHGRSSHLPGESEEDTRSADAREMEVKKLEALELAELALSKLEFLEVTKKGLSKLQILLIELETRHQDWQAGGLTTHHFLGKLREANRQLEQYESSAAPSGWTCAWDRDYRRYFYTHKQTGKTQWDYPDADDIRAEEEKGRQIPQEMHHEAKLARERKAPVAVAETAESVLLASAGLPPPPPPPAEEHPSVKSLMLMYGSDSDTEETPAPQPQQTMNLLPDELPPLPPEPPRDTAVEKKEKKKKKKKDKSKKRDKHEPAGPVVPVGPAMPPVQYMMPGVQPPPPAEQPMDVTPQVPVYGSNDQYAMNDAPLEFGTVIEGAPLPADQSALMSGAPHGENTGTERDPEAGMDIDGNHDPGTSDGVPGPTPATDEKRKKKKEKMGNASISLKKKHVSSMVQKWQKVKKEVELEERDRQQREAEIRRKLAELE